MSPYKKAKIIYNKKVRNFTFVIFILVVVFFFGDLVRLPEPGSRVEERGSAAPIETCFTSIHYSFVGRNRFDKFLLLLCLKKQV
jgi:hypothetical protein